MTIMSTAGTPLSGLERGRPLTVDDLDALEADDGRRYELLDGILVVSPAPIWAHQSVLARMHLVLHEGCPRDLRVLFAPFDWRPSRRTSLQPDVLVARYADLAAVEGGKNLVAPPLLAVEVLSPSTRRYDRMSKLSAYEEAGVGSYWLFEPDPDEPVLTAHDLVDGRYRQVAEVHSGQSWAAELPYPVTISPTDLVADLHE